MKASSDVLVKKWQALLEEGNLPKIQNHYRKAVTAMLLENQERELQISASHGQPQYLLEGPANASADGSGAFPNGNANLKGYDPIMIALVRRSMPNLIAFDVCGVQPMSGPTGLIFAIKSRYTSQGGTEALFNEAATAFSGAGTQAGTAPLPQADADSYKAGTGMTTRAGEILGDGDTGGNWAQMAFSIDRVSVTAKTRALKAEYSMEVQQDLKNVHGLDAENELANILTNEILTEINREVIRTIYNNAVPGAAGTTTPGVVDLDVDAGGRWAIEKFKGLMIRIEQDANAIAVATRRGRGNILMTSADVASALSIAGLLDCGSALKESLSHDGVVENTFVGVLNNRFKVFVDPYVASNTGYYVVGYKGQSAYDAGLFYCPYVPLTMVRAVGENSFQPKIGFKTRYGMVANPFSNAAGNSDGTPTWNTNVYYRKVQVDNLL